LTNSFYFTIFQENYLELSELVLSRCTLTYVVYALYGRLMCKSTKYDEIIINSDVRHTSI